MVCDGPDPPDDSPHNIIPPPRHDLMSNGNHEDSDDEQTEYFGYEPLPQIPESAPAENSSEDESEGNESQSASTSNVPPIESMETTITREVWNGPRVNDPIVMDNDRAQQEPHSVSTLSQTASIGNAIAGNTQPTNISCSRNRTTKHTFEGSSERKTPQIENFTFQVMSIMANFALPQTSIPEWAQSISEEQWKETLNDRIEKLKGNR